MENQKLYQAINDLGKRANVMIRKTCDGRPVIIYDDHRWILNVFFKIFKNQLFDVPNLVYFDAHDDAASDNNQSELLRKIGVNSLTEASEKQFGAFVDYDCRFDDGSWLTTALELGLINDVVNIGNRCNHNIEEMNEMYFNEEKIEHKVFFLDKDLEQELGCRGRLGDTSTIDEYSGLRKFFGIESSFSKNISINSPYILDFDLDFFTIYCDDDKVHGWTQKIMNDKFPTFSDQTWFLNQLIKNANLITICREPNYCGSIGDSNRILNLLDIYFFENRLGTEVTL